MNHLRRVANSKYSWWFSFISLLSRDSIPPTTTTTSYLSIVNANVQWVNECSWRSLYLKYVLFAGTPSTRPCIWSYSRARGRPVFVSFSVCCKEALLAIIWHWKSLWRFYCGGEKAKVQARWWIIEYLHIPLPFMNAGVDNIIAEFPWPTAIFIQMGINK